MTAITDASASEDSVVVITRIFDAPRALVWKAWTDPKRVAQWWGPKAVTTPVCEMDVRPGGTYRIVMRDPDGVEYPMTGVYREVVEPERLVMTDDLAEHPDEWLDRVNPNRRDGAGKSDLEVLSTITFEEHDGKTKLTIRSRFESVAIRDAMLRMGMAEGWSESLDRLHAQLAQMATEGEFVITRVFDAPIDLVFSAYTDCERMKQWWGPKGFAWMGGQMDLRPGGIFLYGMRSPDGHEMWGKFVYREIDAPKRIVFINSFSDKDGNLTRHPLSPNWPLEVLNTLTFSEQGGRTTLILRAIPYAATESERQTFEAGHKSMQQGFAGTFDQLAEYLENA